MADMASLGGDGVWSGASYSSGTDLTTFTGNFGTPTGGGALGDSVKPGMVVILDLHKAVPLHIESVSINLLGSDTLTVKGDATGLGGNGTRFRIHQHAPYKYDLTDEVKRNNPCDLGSRYLWSNYRRIPWTWSRAGEDPYLAWNRVYLPEIGRWTSTDALRSPWTNACSYVRSNPVTRTDPSGLEPGGYASEDEIKKHIDEMRDYDHLKPVKKELDFWDAYMPALSAQQTKLRDLFYSACKMQAGEVFGGWAGKIDKDCNMRIYDEAIDCCTKIADAMARATTDMMRDHAYNGGEGSTAQREFGSAGNKKWKEKAENYCNCGKWANKVIAAHDAYFDDEIRNGKCKIRRPHVFDMYRMVIPFVGHENSGYQDHNWAKFCWGSHCVHVDPWERGTADGSVWGGEDSADWEVERYPAKGVVRRVWPAALAD